jgi:hypothetical protein
MLPEVSPIIQMRNFNLHAVPQVSELCRDDSSGLQVKQAHGSSTITKCGTVKVNSHSNAALKPCL